MVYLDEYSSTYLDTYGIPVAGSTASALPGIQVLVDWVNNPIGATAQAGNNWTDISSYVRLEAGINIQRGRQDNISVVQPGRCTVTVANDDGRFTPGYGSSPYAPGVVIGRRIQVNVKDESGTYHTRFDGMVNEYDVLDTATGKSTLMRLVCVDVLAFLNRFPAFSCWTVEECSTVAPPALQYLMNEPTGSPGVNDTSGNGGPMLAAFTYNNPPYATIPTGSTQAYLSAPTITYQSGSNPVEGAVPPTTYPGNYATATTSTISSPLPSVAFGMTMNNATGTNTQATAAPSSQFQGFLPTPLKVGTNNFTLVGWVWPDGNVVNNPYNSASHVMMSLANTQSSSMLALEAVNQAGVSTYLASFYNAFTQTSFNGTQTGGVTSTQYLVGNAPFMVAVVVKGTTATFYMGGNFYGPGLTLLTGSGGINLTSGVTFNYLTIGGPLGGGQGWCGNISCVNLYQQALTAAQLGDLTFFGAFGSYSSLSGTGFGRVAQTYTGLPSYWTGTIDPGLSYLDYADITGSNPSAVMQSIQSVEHGLFFCDAKGRLNWHDRSRRMGAATPAVTLPAGSYNVGIQPKINDQYLINSEALQNQRGGTGIIAQNQASIAQYGTYPNGSAASPQTAPYMSWGGNWQQRQIATPGKTNQVSNYGSGNILDAASWDVNTLSTPQMKLATPTVDMLGNTSGQSEYVAPSVLYSVEINQAVSVGHNLSWWPNGPESSELFVEGVTETYSTGEASIGFYTSPAFQGRGWLPGNASYGQLDVNARVGISNQTGTYAIVYNPPIPSFSSSMNLGAGANGFVGSRDMLGLFGNLQQKVKPPLLFTQQVTFAQSIPTGIATYIVWDHTVTDTVQAMNQYTNGATSCIIIVPGWYEVCATVNYAANSTGRRDVYIIQNQTGQLRTIAPASCHSTASSPTGITTSAVFWCNQGDAIAVQAFQDSGATVSTSLTFGGSHMSLRWLGAGSNRN